MCARKLTTLTLLLSVALTHSAGNANGNAPPFTRIITTRYGKLQGVVKRLNENGAYKHLKPIEMYLGVPYATSPTGPNRFSPTRTPEPWDGIKFVGKFSPVCPQKLPHLGDAAKALERMPRGRYEHLKRLLPHLQNQSEDCLYLNIYTPLQVECHKQFPNNPAQEISNSRTYNVDSSSRPQHVIDYKIRPGIPVDPTKLPPDTPIYESLPYGSMDVFSSTGVPRELRTFYPTTEQGPKNIPKYTRGKFLVHTNPSGKGEMTSSTVNHTGVQDLDAQKTLHKRTVYQMKGGEIKEIEETKAMDGSRRPKYPYKKKQKTSKRPT